MTGSTSTPQDTKDVSLVDNPTWGLLEQQFSELEKEYYQRYLLELESMSEKERASYLYGDWVIEETTKFEV